MKNLDKTLKTVFAAMFLALSYVMPFLTGQIPEIGSMLCPMHIPILLCKGDLLQVHKQQAQKPLQLQLGKLVAYRE